MLRRGIEEARIDLDNAMCASGLQGLSKTTVSISKPWQRRMVPPTVNVAQRMGKTPNYAATYRKRLLDAFVIRETERGEVDFAVPSCANTCVGISNRHNAQYRYIPFHIMTFAFRYTMDGLLSSSAGRPFLFSHSVIGDTPQALTGRQRPAGSHHAGTGSHFFGEVFEGTTGEVAAFESDIVIDSISGSRYCPLHRCATVECARLAHLWVTADTSLMPMVIESQIHDWRTCPRTYPVISSA